jgi:hypothetical protein
MKTLEEKNEIIAEFMGWKKGHPELFEFRWSDDYFDGKKRMTNKGKLEFNTSWNALMPVAGKIHSILMDECLFFEGINLFNAVNRCDIQTAYEEIVITIELLKKNKL